MEKSEIRIYKNLKGNTSIEVKLDQETVWLNQYQLETLFQTDRTSINRHIRNIYKTEELNENRTYAKITQVQKEGKKTVNRTVKYYNLDVIIAVGYRVNSKQGTEFRIWANKLIRTYLIKGFAINQEKLEKQNKQLLELKKTVKILSNVITNKELSNSESKGLLEIISDYSYALDVLDKYDYQSLEIENVTTNEIYQLTYKEAIQQIRITKEFYGNSSQVGSRQLAVEQLAVICTY